MSNQNRIRAKRYEPGDEAKWDEFVRRSRNGVFLFYRDYLEYHADRFSDCSYLFFQDDQLIGLMPANRVEGTVVSHGGLTFGGIVSDEGMTTGRMLDVFSTLILELQKAGVQKLVYKAVPHIYHLLPAEEDLYALFVHNARLFRRDVSSTIDARRRLPLSTNRVRKLKLREASGIGAWRSQEFLRFMAITEDNLRSRHGVSPVHSGEEMQLLAHGFPENIKLFAAYRDGEMLGGVIVYESANVAHVQYIGSTPAGRELGALDIVVDLLLNDVYREKPYFDFGISTVDDGRTLNSGLIRNKESYGARATVYDSYELDLES